MTQIFQNVLESFTNIFGYCLFLLLGLFPFFIINGLFSEMSVLVKQLPEKDMVASIVGNVFQSGNFAAVLYTVINLFISLFFKNRLRKFGQRTTFLFRLRRYLDVDADFFFLFGLQILGLVDTVLLILFWNKFQFFGISWGLHVFTFFGGIVGCVGIVTIFSYGSKFKPLYVSAISTGLSLSGLYVAGLSFLQGLFPSNSFFGSFELFFFLCLIVELLSFACLLLLFFVPISQNFLTRNHLNFLLFNARKFGSADFNFKKPKKINKNMKKSISKNKVAENIENSEIVSINDEEYNENESITYNTEDYYYNDTKTNRSLNEDDFIEDEEDVISNSLKLIPNSSKNNNNNNNETYNVNYPAEGLMLDSPAEIPEQNNDNEITKNLLKQEEEFLAKLSFKNRILADLKSFWGEMKGGAEPLLLLFLNGFLTYLVTPGLQPYYSIQNRIGGEKENNVLRWVSNVFLLANILGNSITFLKFFRFQKLIFIHVLEFIFAAYLVAGAVFRNWLPFAKLNWTFILVTGLLSIFNGLNSVCCYLEINRRISPHWVNIFAKMGPASFQVGAFVGTVFSFILVSYLETTRNKM